MNEKDKKYSKLLKDHLLLKEKYNEYNKSAKLIAKIKNEKDQLQYKIRKLPR